MVLGWMAQRTSPLVLCLGLGACGEYGPRVYTAHPYRAREHCLGASVAIGVVQASELPANCAGHCLLFDGALYVSVVCEPYPARAVPVTPESSPECATALDLLQPETACASGAPTTPDAGLLGATPGDAAPSEEPPLAP